MGTLKVRVGDQWEVIGAGSSEVLVSDVDPYVIDAAATEELWYSPTVKQLFARVNNEWRIATPNEVAVSRADPALLDPEVELWYDVDASPSFPSTKPVAIDEVWIGAQEPIKPTVELWYDTTASLMKARINSAWVPITTPPELPLGGLVNEALVKSSAADQETRWGGDLSTGSIFLASGKVIQFPNVVGPKIQLYAATFGIGVESGELSLFGSSKVGFHANASNGTKWAEIDANGLGPRTNYNVTWMNGFSGVMDFRVNPAMVTCRLQNVLTSQEFFGFNEKQICALPAGVPAPWGTVSATCAMYIGSSITAHVRVDVRSTGVWAYCLSDNIGAGDASIYATITWSR